jgi:hypothetical protein
MHTLASLPAGAPWRRPVPRACVLAAGILCSACELQEVTVVDFADVVVAEVYVTLRDAPGASTVQGFVHGAASGGQPDSRTFDDALLRVTRGDGLVVDLGVVPIEACLEGVPSDATGTCFAADTATAALLGAGDELALEIALGGGGGTAEGSLTVPDDFDLIGLSGECRLAPDTTLEIRWSRSEGAWAYLNETLIEGLAAPLAAEGIEAEDSLYLLGLSIAATDTTVVFPSEFGIFDRFDLDQDLAVRLQRGLPDGVSAAVSIAAVERNHVNWARGGNFNPSGMVRVSSLRGAAVGTFGAALVREFLVRSSTDTIPLVPGCS